MSIKRLTALAVIVAAGVAVWAGLAGARATGGYMFHSGDLAVIAYPNGHTIACAATRSVDGYGFLCYRPAPGGHLRPGYVVFIGDREVNAVRSGRLSWSGLQP